jgi:hypothetical protein
MQRLKGLTTGGFPTFIDAADNFDPSQTIREDNWVLQLKKKGTFAFTIAPGYCVEILLYLIIYFYFLFIYLIFYD